MCAFIRYLDHGLRSARSTFAAEIHPRVYSRIGIPYLINRFALRRALRSTFPTKVSASTPAAAITAFVCLASSFLAARSLFEANRPRTPLATAFGTGWRERKQQSATSPQSSLRSFRYLSRAPLFIGVRQRPCCFIQCHWRTCGYIDACMPRQGCTPDVFLTLLTGGVPSLRRRFLCRYIDVCHGRDAPNDSLEEFFSTQAFFFGYIDACRGRGAPNYS